MITTMEPDVNQKRREWLEWRRGGIGASESAALFGLDPFKTKLDVWCSKVLGDDDRAPSEAAEIGLLMEPVLNELYERRTGRKIVLTQVRARCHDEPTIQATLDGLDDAEEGVETKCVGFPHSELCGEPGTDELPPWWIVQAQHQMLARRLNAVNIPVMLHGREFRVYRVERNPDLQSLLRDQIPLFWHEHVETKTAPDPDLPADARHLARIFSRCEGEIELKHDTLELVAEWEYCLACYKEANAPVIAMKERADLLRAQIITILGNARFASLQDGRILERAVRTRKAHDVRESSWIELKIRALQGASK